MINVVAKEECNRLSCWNIPEDPSYSRRLGEWWNIMRSKEQRRSILIMHSIEFIDTFQEFSHKTLKSFLIESHRLSPNYFSCAWIKWDLMHIRREQQAKRQNNCWSSGWWSAKNIDYRDKTAKHFHSAPNKRRFAFSFCFAFPHSNLKRRL